MNKKMLKLIILIFFIQPFLQLSAENSGKSNLLLNSEFKSYPIFSLNGKQKKVSTRGSTPFWSTEQWGNIEVLSKGEIKLPQAFAANSIGNIICLHPGKKISQVIPLSETNLSFNDLINLRADGYQYKKGALTARIKLLKINNIPNLLGPVKQPGKKESKPSLVPFKTYEATSKSTGKIALEVKGSKIIGKLKPSKTPNFKSGNTYAIEVEFSNKGKEKAYILNPRLFSNSPNCEFPRMTSCYRYIPKTMQKLWNGAPIHIILIGTDIDAGVLKQELIVKYNLKPENLCINSLGTTSTGIIAYQSLLHNLISLNRKTGLFNDGSSNKLSWVEQYPGIISRPEGPGPDLVIISNRIFHNSKESEIGMLEGLVRWIQRNFPYSEFLFPIYMDDGKDAVNFGEFQELGFRYSIPVLDLRNIKIPSSTGKKAPNSSPPAKTADTVMASFLAQSTLKAFESWNPIKSGRSQLYSPERVSPFSYGWEGDSITYTSENSRLKNKLFIFDDTAVNFWVNYDGGDGGVFIDGKKVGQVKSIDSAGSDINRERQSSFAYGNCKLGERHILEIDAKNLKIEKVESKLCPKRRFIGVENSLWQKNELKVKNFKSKTGAPYGNKVLTIPAGKSVSINVVASDVSIAYADDRHGGILHTSVDGKPGLAISTVEPFVCLDHKMHFIENRKGILGIGYGWHNIKVTAKHNSVHLLGIFTYDSRSNRRRERRISGFAAGGDTIKLTPAFITRPVVLCYGDLTCKFSDVTKDSVKFEKGSGAYEVIGGGAPITIHRLAKSAWQPISEKQKLLDKPKSWKTIYKDNFDRKEIGDKYVTVQGNWAIHKGALQTSSEKGGNVILFNGAKLEDNYRITFTYQTYYIFTPQGKAEVSLYANVPAETPTDLNMGYLFAFANHNDRFSSIIRSGNTLTINEKSKQLIGDKNDVIIQRIGNRLTVKINNKLVFDGRDLYPPQILPRNNWCGFFAATAGVEFDNFTISILEKF